MLLLYQSTFAAPNIVQDLDGYYLSRFFTKQVNPGTIAQDYSRLDMQALGVTGNGT